MNPIEKLRVTFERLSCDFEDVSDSANRLRVRQKRFRQSLNAFGNAIEKLVLEKADKHIQAVYESEAFKELKDRCETFRRERDEALALLPEDKKLKQFTGRHRNGKRKPV